MSAGSSGPAPTKSPSARRPSTAPSSSPRRRRPWGRSASSCRSTPRHGGRRRGRPTASGGREDTGVDALDWARRGQALGAGEILLNSIDRDGTREGYDLELLRRVSDAASIPVIASGGAGDLGQIARAVHDGHADAVLVASLLHDREHTVAGIKRYLREKGVNVR